MRLRRCPNCVRQFHYATSQIQCAMIGQYVKERRILCSRSLHRQRYADHPPGLAAHGRFSGVLQSISTCGCSRLHSRSRRLTPSERLRCWTMMVFMTSKTTGSETVFLSAGRDTDLERVRSDLRDRDFRTVEWRDLTTGGLARGLPAALESCDALVAVLDGTEVPAAVLMEIGAALGRGLPVVIVTAGTLETLDLPAALHELPAISAGHAQTTEARQAVSRRLVATLRTLINNAGDSSLKAASGSTVGSSSITGHSALEDDFARKVVAAIDRLGVRIVEEYEVGPVSRSRMADLAIWIEGL